uniref:phospholipase D-like domain-containing protein n=2 Tax=Pseudomonas TaxID=286 RepID=UPI002FC6DE40
LHQKVMLIDSSVVAIGSANLDNRSFRLNFEITLLTFDPGFATEVEQMLEEDLRNCRELIGADRLDLHRLQQLGMRVARLISPIL